MRVKGGEWKWEGGKKAETDGEGRGMEGEDRERDNTAAPTDELGVDL